MTARARWWSGTDEISQLARRESSARRLYAGTQAHETVPRALHSAVQEVAEVWRRLSNRLGRKKERERERGRAKQSAAGS